MDISIKWPNDIYHHRNKKVGGIICQSHYNGRVFDVTIGIGINISNKKPTICMDEIASKLQKKEVALDALAEMMGFARRAMRDNVLHGAGTGAFAAIFG